MRRSAIRTGSGHAPACAARTGLSTAPSVRPAPRRRGHPVRVLARPRLAGFRGRLVGGGRDRCGRRRVSVRRRVSRPAFGTRPGVLAVPADVGTGLAAVRHHQAGREHDAAQCALSGRWRTGKVVTRHRLVCVTPGERAVHGTAASCSGSPARGLGRADGASAAMVPPQGTPAQSPKARYSKLATRAWATQAKPQSSSLPRLELLKPLTFPARTTIKGFIIVGVSRSRVSCSQCFPC